MDYRNLLKKYIKTAVVMEGTDFRLDLMFMTAEEEAACRQLIDEVEKEERKRSAGKFYTGF
jgi:hypothetical protein